VIANKRINGKEKKSNSKIQMNDKLPRNFPFMQKAAEMELCTNNPEKMESIEEEEAEGR